MFTLALIFAGISDALAQTLAPRAVTCLPEDALHPVAGKLYTYQIDVPVQPTLGDPWNTTTDPLEYMWYVTQLDLAAASTDKFFINGTTTFAPMDDPGDGTGNFIATFSTGEYATAAGTASATADNIVQITWKNIVYDATKPIFVVIGVVGNNGVCDPANLKVFKIEPKIAFTLDIDNLTAAGAQNTPAVYGDLYAQCVSPIVSAFWNETAQKVDYDFGVNYLLYEVVAANWSKEWNLAVKLSGVQPLERITVEWSKDKTFATGVFTMSGPTNSTAIGDVLDYTNPVPANNVTASAGNGQVGAAGESIFIRVTLDHSTSGFNNYEGLEDQEITLAVDGKTNWDATLTTPAWTIGDVHYDNGPSTAVPCAPLVVDDFANDVSRQDLKARPTVTVAVGAGATQMPAPGLAPVLNPKP